MTITKSSQSFPSFIAILETLLLFIIGVLGNRISESLSISPTTLIIYTGVGLLILSVISYIKTIPFSKESIEKIEIGIKAWRFIPRTMISIFPVGVLLGLVLGANLPTYYPSMVNTFGVRPYESVGIFIGLVMGFFFAILIDGRLSAAICFGYGIAFATSILVVRSDENQMLLTYVGWVFGFGLFAVVLTWTDVLFKKIRAVLMEQRIE